MPRSWHRQGGRQADMVGWSWRWTEDGREEGNRKEMKKERRGVIP